MIVHYYGAFNLTLMKSGYWSINMIRSLKYWQDQLHLVFDGLLSLDIDHMQQNCGHLMHLKSNNFVIVFVHDTFQELENLKQENRRLCEELKELRRTVQVGVLNVLIFPHSPPPPSQCNTGNYEMPTFPLPLLLRTLASTIGCNVSVWACRPKICSTCSV